MIRIRNCSKCQPKHGGPSGFTLPRKSLSSFDNKGYKLNTTLSVEMSIPQLTKPLIGKLKIVKIDDKDSCKCIIQGMTPEQDDLVHNYVLKRQKEEIDEKKKI